jgi:uncharacterized protein (DUF4415 family)
LPTKAEDAAIQAGIAADPDTAELSAEQFGQLKTLKLRGRPRLERPKQRLMTRVDGDILDAIKASGEGWQTRVNQVLRDAVKRGKFGT